MELVKGISLPFTLTWNLMHGVFHTSHKHSLPSHSTYIQDLQSGFFILVINVILCKNEGIN